MSLDRDVAFESEGLRLAGTFSSPDKPGPVPAVLMVAGSGESDRDDNSPKLRIDAFPQIAAYLAVHGIAGLRYDKRGVGTSDGDYWKTGFNDHVIDAAAGIRWLQSHADVDPKRIFVLGHSEGSLIAVRVAATGSPTAGLILLAGSAKSGEETLVWQAQRIAQGITGLNRWLVKALRIDVAKSQRKALDKIKNTDRDSMRVQLVQKINVKWMREFLVYDPTEDLARIEVPVLAITGEKDIQVDPADLQVMAGLVRGDFESHLMPDMTHILRPDPGEPSLATYKKQARRPVDDRMLELIGDWLERKCAD